MCIRDRDRGACKSDDNFLYSELKVLALAVISTNIFSFKVKELNRDVYKRQPLYSYTNGI